MNPARLFAAVLCALLVSILGCPQRGTDPPRIERVAGAADRVDLAGDKIRIATVNMWGVSALGFDWSRNIDERFEALARRLGRNRRGVDFVLVQEAWKDSARRRVLDDPAVQMAFPYRVDAVEQPGGAGLVLLSAYPIEEARFLRFASQGNCWKIWEADCIAGKGVLAARVRLGDEDLWIANTHLIACYAEDRQPKTSCDRGDDNADDRASQLAELRGFLEPLSEQAPVAVGGDFNFTRTSRLYQSLLSANRSEPQRDRQSDSNASTPTGWVDPGDLEHNPNRIDYVFSRDGGGRQLRASGPVEPFMTERIELDSGDSVRLSDHLALVVEFCLVDDESASEGRCTRGGS